MTNLFQPLVDSTWNFVKFIIDSWRCLPSYVEYKIPNDEYRIGDISIPIGYTCKDKCYLNIGQNSVHTMVTGTSGYGKSNLINSIICSISCLYPNVSLYLYDLKGGIELSQYRNMSNVKDFKYKINDVSNALDTIYQMILDKYETMLSNNKRCVSIYDERSIIIIDEVSLCNRKHDIPILEKCLAISRACGIYFIISSQRFSSNDVISPVIRNLIDNIITFKLDSNTSKLTLGTDEASKLDSVGRGFIKFSDKTILFQSFYINQKQIDEVVSKKQVIKYNSKNINNNDTTRLKSDNINLYTEVQIDNTDWISKL